MPPYILTSTDPAAIAALIRQIYRDADAPADDVTVIKVGNTSIVLLGNLRLGIVGNYANGPDDIEGSNLADMLIGNGGNDYIVGEGGDDILLGGVGRDEIYGGTGDDILIGGLDDDYLEGGRGSDTYVFHHGDGRDTIHADNHDILKLGQGITAQSVQFIIKGKDLVIRIDEYNRVTLQSWFHGAGYQLDMLRFADGDQLSASQVNALQLVIEATSGHDRILGTSHRNLIEGGAGNDSLSGMDGDDILKGGADNDTLLGGNGNDILEGGVGNDRLEGGAGTDTLRGGDGFDTYVFQLGDGHDTIEADQQDTLQLGPGITAASLQVSRKGHDLVLVIDNDNQVTIAGWFRALGLQLAALQFWNGKQLSRDQINAMHLPLRGTPEDDHLVGGEQSSLIHGGAGNDRLDGQGGDDQLDGETGDDLLRGGAGDDILVGGPGRDTMYGDGGTDIYLFRPADGRDTIFADRQDILRFGAGIAPSQVSRLQRDNDLVLRMDTGTGDEIIIVNWFHSPQSQVARFEFADGTSMTAEQFIGRDIGQLAPQQGGELNGTEANNLLLGDTGDDILRGFGGRDKLFGGAGADQLHGGSGNDILEGGTGADLLWGGAGNDTYVFKLGDGHDTITEDDRDARSRDELHFGAGIDASNISFSRQHFDLVIQVSRYDTVTIKNWFITNAYRLDRVVFADGSSLDDQQIDQLLPATDQDHRIEGSAGNDRLLGTAADDVMLGGFGDDIYTYRQRGHGMDRIIESTVGGRSRDELHFEGDISFHHLWLSRVDTDLVINIMGTRDGVTIHDWFGQAQSRIGKIQAAGRSLGPDKIDIMIQLMAQFAPPPPGMYTLGAYYGNMPNWINYHWR